MLGGTQNDLRLDVTAMTGIGQPEWIAVITTMIVVMTAVFFHFEMIAALNRWTKRQPINQRRDHHHRPTLLKVIFALLIIHIVEIWWFGAAFWWLDGQAGLGDIVGYADMNFLEYVYLSATTYTTVGYGDLYVTGPMRFLAGTEALVGFMLITWSASFTYLVMARTWGEGTDSPL